MVQILLFSALVVAQALLVGFSPLGGYWEFYATCVASDALLGWAFLKNQALRKASDQARFQQANEAMRWVFDLTLAHQDQWRSMVKEMARMDPEDLTAVEGVREVLASLDAKDKPLDLAQESAGLTLESMLDSTQAMILLSQSLTHDLDIVFTFFLQTLRRLQDTQTAFRLNHFRLREAVDFMGQMGIKTNQYSEQIVLEVLEEFGQITQFSEGIGTEVMGRVRRLMDATNPESLEAIRRGSTSIHLTMDKFFVNLEKANSLSRKALDENLAQVLRVEEMAQAIGAFSENIRMISLNLNIQAARLTQLGGSSGKGFQVLATKLSEFSVKAGELADQQRDSIATASAVMNRAGQAEMEQLAALMNEIPRIKAELDPFGAIVNQAYSEFEAVGAVMGKLSTSISDRLKGVIGKFQFQDLVRQEQLHIQGMFEHVRDRAEPAAGSPKAADEDLRVHSWNELLHTFECLATTENERFVIREFRRMHPFLAEEDGECLDDTTAGSVSLF